MGKVGLKFDGPKNPKASGYTKHWAEFWHITQRTAQRWFHEPPPMPRLHEVPEMLKWSPNAPHQAVKFRARCVELKLAIERAAGNTPASEPPSTSPPSDEPAGERKRSTSKDRIAFLDERLNHARTELELATRAKDKADIKFWSDQVIEYTNAIRQLELAADRLGVETGDFVPRKDFDRFLIAFVFWSMRSVDVSLDELCTKLTDLSFPEEARQVLEPYLLSQRFLSPFVYAATISAENELPDWIPTTLADAVDDYLENGSQQFAELLGLPEANPSATA